MAGGVDGGDARKDFVSRLYECRPVRQWATDAPEEIAVAQSGFAHRTALYPESEFGRAENIARPCENGLAVPHEAADMVRVSVRDDDHIDIGRSEPKVLQTLQKRTVGVAKSGVEQDLFGTGVDQSRNETVLVSIAVDEVRGR